MLERVADQLGDRTELHLFQNMGLVRTRRLDAQAEALRDAGNGFSIGQHQEDFELAIGEPLVGQLAVG